MNNRRRDPDRASIEAAAAVETALLVGLVEVMNDFRDLYTAVVIERVFEDAVDGGVSIEHQVAADKAR